MPYIHPKHIEPGFCTRCSAVMEVTRVRSSVSNPCRPLSSEWWFRFRCPNAIALSRAVPFAGVLSKHDNYTQPWWSVKLKPRPIVSYVPAPQLSV